VSTWCPIAGLTRHSAGAEALDTALWIVTAFLFAVWWTWFLVTASRRRHSNRTGVLSATDALLQVGMAAVAVLSDDIVIRLLLLGSVLLPYVLVASEVVRRRRAERRRR
jgi:hypothetical protein